MSKIDTALSNVFDVQPAEAKQIIEFRPLATEVADTVEGDFDNVKANLYNLLEKGETAIEDLTDIARTEESPRAFEVLNSMLSTMADLSMKLIDVEERKVKLKKLSSDSDGSQISSGGNVTTNNVVFVGTTQELQEQIKKRLTGQSTT
jgi:predicted RNA-binding protein